MKPVAPNLISSCGGRDPAQRSSLQLSLGGGKKWGESKMVEANWPEWIVLRCEPKTDTDGNTVEREEKEGRRLIGEEESFPAKSHKTD